MRLPLFPIELVTTLFILYLYFPTRAHSHPKLPIPWALPTPSNRHHHHHHASTITGSPTSTQSHPDPIPKLTQFQHHHNINKYLPDQKAIANEKENINANAVNTARLDILHVIEEFLKEMDNVKPSKTTNPPIKIVEQENVLHYSNDNNFGSLSMSLSVIIVWIIMSLSLMYAVIRWNKMRQHVEELNRVKQTDPHFEFSTNSIEEILEMAKWQTSRSILQSSPISTEHHSDCSPHNGMCPSRQITVNVNDMVLRQIL